MKPQAWRISKLRERAGSHQQFTNITRGHWAVALRYETDPKNPASRDTRPSYVFGFLFFRSQCSTLSARPTCNSYWPRRTAMWLRDFCVFSCALLCSVVPGATDATRNQVIKSKLYFNGAAHKPGGRDFSALQARQFLIANPGLGTSNLSGRTKS